MISSQFLRFLKFGNSLKESHEALAVNLIKTKLKGHARNVIDNLNLRNNRETKK